MSRLTAKAIATYFRESGYMKPGVDFWSTLSLDNKQTFRTFITRVRPGIASGTHEERLAAFTALMPEHLGRDTAQQWASDPKLKHFLVSANKRPRPPEIHGEKGQTLAKQQVIRIGYEQREPDEKENAAAARLQMMVLKATFDKF